MATCTDGPVTCWIANQADILNNVANSLAPVEQLLTGAAYIIGLSFAFKAIYVLKVYGEARTMMASNSSIKEPILYLIVAGVFIYFPSGVELVMNTTFGYSNPMAYGPVNSKNNMLNTLVGDGSVVGRPLSMVIQVIGIIAFIRGWVLLARSGAQGQPPGGTGKGLIHIFGGIIAINIIGTINIINNTLYGAG